MEVRPQHGAINRGRQLKHVVMIVPVDAHVQKAEHVAQEQRHQRQQRGGVAATRHLQLQHHDRDDYGDHAVAEGLETILFHGHRSPTPWSGKFPPYQSGHECRDAEDAQEDRKLFRSRIARLSDPDPHVDGRTDQPPRDKELRARYQTWPTAAERVTEQHTSKQQREAAANYNHRLHSIFLPIRPCVPGGGGGLAFSQFAEKSDERKFSPPSAATPFHHIALKIDKATQEVIERRIKAAGYKNPD